MRAVTVAMLRVAVLETPSTGYAVGSYEALKRHGEGGDGSTCAGARSQDVAQQLPGLKDSEPAEVTPQQPTDPAHAIQFHGAQTQRLLELHSLVLAGAEQHQQWLHGGEAPYVEFGGGASCGINQQKSS